MIGMQRPPSSATSSPRFDVLGPVQARVGDHPVAVGGGRQLALLALLLVHSGEVVSRDRLVNQLWPEPPPASAGRSLDAYISRLRRAFREAGAAAVIDTRVPGYLLRAVDLDAREFGVRVAAAGGADPAVAAPALRQALALWRGQAYSEFSDAPWAREESMRLEELRRAALAARIDADLALGRHAALVGELELLTARYPSHERFVVHLMTALYRSGRQSDALAAYQAARNRLADELGVDPGHDLRLCQAQVLAHDAALDLPQSQPIQPALVVTKIEAPAKHRHRVSPRLVAVVLTAALFATLAVWTLTGREGGSRLALGGQSVGALDVGDGRVTARIGLHSSPTDMATAGGRVWVTNAADGTVTRIDPRDGGHVDQTVRVGSSPSGIAGGFGAVWVANAQSSTVSRVDVDSGELVQTVAGAQRPVAVATGDGAVWVADAGDDKIVEVDPRTGAATRWIRLSGDPAGVAVGFGSVWVSESRARRVIRLDPGSGAITAEIDVGGGAGPISTGADAVWVVNRLDGTLSRVDPRTETVTATVPVGDASSVVTTSDDVFVAGAQGVTIVDAAMGDVREHLPTDAAITAITLVGGTPWVATSTPEGAAHRGGRLQVVGSDPLRVFDPTASNEVHPGIWNAVGDGLTAVVEADGTAELVPDLAVSLPRPTSGGLTYRFHLRPGIRYSNGVTVLASDLRRGLERLFTHGSGVSDSLSALRGAEVCSTVRCDLSRGVVTNDTAGSVELRLVRPDPQLLYTLAMPAFRPVPPGTPGPGNVAGVPGTGPYRVSKFVPGRELDLERNPYFRPWSPTAQPDGFADSIVDRVQPDAAGRIAAVVDGRTDLALDVGTAPDLAAISARYASQVRRHLQPMVVFATLNTRRAPFDDVRVRRALDLALDRRAAVAAFGGAELATPTCQVLPPTIPGHVAYCPRTTGRNDGAWHGTDLTAARALVRASGTAGMRADFVGWTGDPPTRLVAPVLVQALRRLGYRSRAVLIDDLGTFARSVGPGNFALSQATWLSGAPSDFLTQFLACRSSLPDQPVLSPNAGGYCNHRLDRLLAAATTADVAVPNGGATGWARADHLAVDDAAVVPVVDLAGVEMLSRRAGHFTLDSTSLPQIDQLWVR